MLRDFHPGHQVLIDFTLIFDHNLDPTNPIFRAPAAGRARFIKKSFAAIGTDFGFILIATSFHFPLQNRLKLFQKVDPKTNQFFDRFLDRFFIDLGSVLEANLEPSWPHFPPRWRYAVARQPLFCWVYVTFRFFARPGPIFAQFGLDFGRFEP